MNSVFVSRINNKLKSIEEMMTTITEVIFDVKSLLANVEQENIKLNLEIISLKSDSSKSDDSNNGTPDTPTNKNGSMEFVINEHRYS